MTGDVDDDFALPAFDPQLDRRERLAVVDGVPDEIGQQFTGGSATVDVTSIVRGWVTGKMPNQGFVLRGKLEDNGSNGNDSCSLSFGKDAVLTIEQ